MGKLNSKSVKRYVCIFVVFFVIAILLISNLYLTVSQYTVESAKIPQGFDGFRILQISDLHQASFGSDNARLLSKVDALAPDIVVITGDIVSRSDENFDVAISLCEKLASRYQCFYIVGNHEQSIEKSRPKDFKRLMHGIANSGVKILDNDKLILERNGDKIALYGGKIADYYYLPLKPLGNRSEQVRLKVSELTKDLGRPDQNIYTVLLQHDSLFSDEYADWGADLAFSGHVHGGAIRLPFIGGILSPDRHLFPKYAAGKYAIGEKVMIVSRGLGNNPGMIRFGSLPDLVVVTLNK